MSRIIATEAPGKTRNQLRRTIAEALRCLSQKQQLDEEVKDLSAIIVYCLHGIADTVDQAAEAWDKRDYYMKAERFREQWRWLEPMADQLNVIVHEGRWNELPVVLARLMPYFADIKIKQMTRRPTLWQGAYERLMRES